MEFKHTISERLFGKLKNKIAPRWLIFLIEFVIITCSFMLALFVVQALKSGYSFDRSMFLTLVGVNILVTLAGMYLSKTYVGVIRFTEIKDLITVIKFSLIQAAFWSGYVLWARSFTGQINLGFSLVVVNACIVFTSLICFRLLVKGIYFSGQRNITSGRSVMIFGAGELGMATHKALELDGGRHYKIAGYLDDDRRKIGKSLNGIEIFNASAERLSELLIRRNVDEVIIAISELSADRKMELATVCSEQGIMLKVIPPAHEWMNGIFTKKQLRRVTIESLLGRDEIKLKARKKDDLFADRVVLVTGAAGSIGSEICRQLVKAGVERLIMFDQAESALHDFLLELKQNNDETDLCLEIGSVRDEARVNAVMWNYQPEYVFHAAAYKHVPIMEYFPAEAVLTNVCGTRILADAAIQTGVKKFVMISTDKAVNPTNIMGATKRIAEIYTQSIAEAQSETEFVTTRFGNVLGSNGSVVPYFTKQIQNGGPVTVTHPDITRYFMTIPEACSLVLEACKMGKGGDIFVFDMGEPIKISDMARKMIHLSGFVPDQDILIEYTGLRPGEKMYEELFTDSENLTPTYHPKIMTARREERDYDIFNEMLEQLKLVANDHNQKEVRKIIKSIVPEYKENIKKDRPALNTPNSSAQS